ncbi:hypothetical protein Hdeb2414_s0001g00029431 [Helianthus debilis subsp. tardiflorus]
MFDYCNYRVPLTKFYIEVLVFHEVHLSQMNPFGLAKVCQFELVCRGSESDPDLDVFQAFYKLNRTGDWYIFEVQNKNATCYSWITSSLKDWKYCFFLIDDRCIPVEKIRSPVTAGDQGGSSSAPPEQVIKVSPLRSVSMVASDKGKSVGSSGAKNFGSKVILYGSEHQSVEDEGVVAEVSNAGGQPQISLKRRRNPLSMSDPNPKELKKTKSASKIVILEDEADYATEFSTVEGLLENLDAHLHGGKTPRDRPFTFPTSPLCLGGPTTKLVADTEMPDPLIFKKTNPSPSGKPTTRVDSNVSRPSPQQFDGGDSASLSPLWYETEVVFVCRELGSGDAMHVDSVEALEKYVRISLW